MLATPSFVTRCAMAIFPRSCFADRVTGKPGLIRILLNRLGPSVLSSPLRRMVQTLSLFLFIVLFFYVCWPYSARPAAVGQQSDNWRLVEVEQHTGSFRFEADLRPDWIGDEATVLYVTNGNDGSSYVGAFKVANIAGNMLSLRPVGEAYIGARPVFGRNPVRDWGVAKW